MASIPVLLPDTVEITVKLGDTLTLTTPIARSMGPLEQTKLVVPLAKLLQFAPEQIFKKLQKGVGDRVYKGEVLAKSESVFKTKKYIADSDSYISHIDHETGVVTLQMEGTKGMVDQVIASRISGTVEQINGQTVQVEVEKLQTFELSESPPLSIGGMILVTDELKARDLSQPQVKDSIITAFEFTPYIVAKLEALGCLGILVAHDAFASQMPHLDLLNDSDFAKLIDFSPRAVYANARDTTLYCYR